MPISSAIRTTTDTRDAIAVGDVDHSVAVWTFGRTGSLTSGTEAVDLWPGKDVLGIGYEQFANPADVATGLTCWSSAVGETVTVGAYYIGAAGDFRFGTAVLAGTAGIPLLDSVTGLAASALFVNKFFVVTPALAWGAAAGNIFIARASALTRIYRIIPATGNVDESCGLMVPTGKVLVVGGWAASTTAAKPVTFYLRSSGSYDPITRAGIVAQRYHYHDMAELSDSFANFNRAVALRFPAGSMVKIGCKTTSNGGSATGGFDGWFENE